MIYSCPFLDGGCGFCCHELDSLTYMHTIQDAILSKKAGIVCGQKGILKYLFHGQKWSPTWLPSMRILPQNKNSKWRLLI